MCAWRDRTFDDRRINTYRKNGGSLIGMTNLQEAKLAREAEICYDDRLVIDYDCWHPHHDAVTH
jgi:5'-methylthioadenosine phosphorylase